MAMFLLAGLLAITAPVWLPRLRDHLLVAVLIIFGIGGLAVLKHVWS